ncbi:hypothetical protein HY090_02550 [Candidatus Kaiserbacteria bacterium]|nr:hypothetical protein [Candidatus Kaiserbacteria bacterium]
MNFINTYKSLIVAITIAVVTLIGVWLVLDLTAFSFDTPSIVAHATTDPCCDGGGGGGGGELQPGIPDAPPFCILSVSSESIDASGDDVTLSWETENATNAYINGVGAITAPGINTSAVVHITQTTTFTGSVWNTHFGNPPKTVVCVPVTVVVNPPPPPPPPSCTITLTKDKITWTSSNATSFDSIVPLTAGDPQIPKTPGSVGGTIFSGYESDLFGQYGSIIAQDAFAHGGITGSFTSSSHPGIWTGGSDVGLTLNHTCSLINPAAEYSTYTSRSYDSPGNNSVITWDGGNWFKYGANNHNSHLWTLACVTPTTPAFYTLNGSYTFTPPLGVGTHTYRGTVSGPGGTATCEGTVTVPPPPPPPPQNGCIQVLKETFDPSGNTLTPVAQFSFKLDGATTTQNDANGNAIFTSVTPGVHQVSEVSAGPTWNLLSVTPANGSVTVQSGSVCAAVVFKNKQVITSSQPSCTLSANPSSVTQGNPSTLSWTTTNATSISIDHGIGSVTPVGAGSHSVSPSTTTTYTATVAGPGGTATCQSAVTVAPPPQYGPYCGDGIVNQPWEQCDSTSGCSDKCQLGNQCVDLVLARVNVTNVLNSATKPGNMTSDLFIGGSAMANKIPQGKWFAVFYNGSYVNDPDIENYEDVPGLAVERTTGQIQTLMFGSYPFSQIDSAFNEHVEGNIETWQANIMSQVNDGGQDTVENAFDGDKQLDEHRDEIWLSGGKSYFWLSVNAQDDGFYTLYDKAVSCVPPPVLPFCNLSANPMAVSPGGSSALSWTTTNATSISIDHGVGSVTPVVSGSHSVTPSSTTTYTATVTGPGGTAHCSVPVTVLPPGQGCIQVLKETFTPSGASLTPVAQFSFKLDGATTTQNDANGNAIFTGVTPGVHQVTEIPAGPTWTLLSVTPASGNVTVSTGPVCAAVVFKNKQVVNAPNTPSCTLDASATSITVGDSSTLSWTTSDITATSIDSGVGSVTPVSAGSTSVSPSSTTTYTLTGTGPDGNVTCHKTIVVNPVVVPITPACTLSASAASITTGSSVKLSWTSSNVTSGSIDNNVGSTTPVSSGTTDDIFPPSTINYTATFTGPNGSIQCSVLVHVTSGPGGCTGNCGGGGLNQPNVSLFKKPGDQTLAFVSLSQIPYTGFEAGPALTMIFWLSIVLLSATIAYFIAGKDSMRYLLAYVLGGVAGVPMRDIEREREAEREEMYGAPYPSFDEEAVQELSVVQPTPTPPLATYAAPVFKVAEPVLPDVASVIESRAHAAGVLMSPEAVTLAIDLSPNRAEALRMFGDVLKEAVRTLPREDGWIMLTADRLNALRGNKVEIKPVASVGTVLRPPASIDESAAAVFAGAVVSGNRESAFSIIRSLEHDGVKPTALMTATATVLDKLYRARRLSGQGDNRSAPDVALADKATHVSDQQLAHLVEVFTHSLDHVYSSPFTGVKLALAQAFEVIG